MFENLQKRLSSALEKVRGKSRITEREIDAVLAEIRTGLLEADVHFRVARDFLARVRERCLREEVRASLSPESQILKVLSDELKDILGSHSRELNLSAKPPAVVLLCGLQGSGKTTSCAKLGLYLKSQGKRVAVVSIDVYRPAAMAQLAVLAKKFEIDVFEFDAATKPRQIVTEALSRAKNENFDALLVDTAGRLQVDDELMKELVDVCHILEPIETLLVVDAMMGQQAVEVSDGFNQKIPLTGAILTKLDGDARGGAALSLVAVTGKPIKFIGTGERPTDFELFHPDRISSRLLDMGDVLSLIEKAQQVITEEEVSDVTSRIKGGDNFTLEDFKNQLGMLSRMGPISGLLKMLPGMGAMKEQLEGVDSDKELKRVNAILSSMTPTERARPEVLNGSRRARIAKGSGTEVSDVNGLVKRFMEARKMMKNFGKMASLMGGGGAGLPTGNMGGLGSARKGRGFGRKF